MRISVFPVCTYTQPIKTVTYGSSSRPYLCDGHLSFTQTSGTIALSCSRTSSQRMGYYVQSERHVTGGRVLTAELPIPAQVVSGNVVTNCSHRLVSYM